MIGNYLQKQLNELRLSDCLCDLELVCNNGISFKVHHGVFLALSHRPFDKFNHRLMDAVKRLPSGTKKMFLNQVSEVELKAIVEFMYGIPVKTKKRFDCLVKGLEKLSMDHLIEEAGGFTFGPEERQTTRVSVQIPETTLTGVAQNCPRKVDLSSSVTCREGNQDKSKENFSATSIAEKIACGKKMDQKDLNKELESFIKKEIDEIFDESEQMEDILAALKSMKEKVLEREHTTELNKKGGHVAIAQNHVDSTDGVCYKTIELGDNTYSFFNHADGFIRNNDEVVANTDQFVDNTGKVNDNTDGVDDDRVVDADSTDEICDQNDKRFENTDRVCMVTNDLGNVIEKHKDGSDVIVHETSKKDQAHTQVGKHRRNRKRFSHIKRNKNQKTVEKLVTCNEPKVAEKIVNSVKIPLLRKTLCRIQPKPDSEESQRFYNTCMLSMREPTILDQVRRTNLAPQRNMKGEEIHIHRDFLKTADGIPSQDLSTVHNTPHNSALGNKSQNGSSLIPALQKLPQQPDEEKRIEQLQIILHHKGKIQTINAPALIYQAPDTTSRHSGKIVQLLLKRKQTDENSLKNDLIVSDEENDILNTGEMTETHAEKQTVQNQNRGLMPITQSTNLICLTLNAELLSLTRNAELRLLSQKSQEKTVENQEYLLPERQLNDTAAQNNKMSTDRKEDDGEGNSPQNKNVTTTDNQNNNSDTDKSLVQSEISIDVKQSSLKEKLSGSDQNHKVDGMKYVGGEHNLERKLNFPQIDRTSTESEEQVDEKLEIEAFDLKAEENQQTMTTSEDKKSSCGEKGIAKSSNKTNLWSDISVLHVPKPELVKSLANMGMNQVVPNKGCCKRKDVACSVKTSSGEDQCPGRSETDYHYVKKAKISLDEETRNNIQSGGEKTQKKCADVSACSFKGNILCEMSSVTQSLIQSDWAGEKDVEESSSSNTSPLKRRVHSDSCSTPSILEPECTDTRKVREGNSTNTTQTDTLMVKKITKSETYIKHTMLSNISALDNCNDVLKLFTNKSVSVKLFRLPDKMKDAKLCTTNSLNKSYQASHTDDEMCTKNVKLVKETKTTRSSFDRASALKTCGKTANIKGSGNDNKTDVSKNIAKCKKSVEKESIRNEQKSGLGNKATQNEDKKDSSASGSICQDTESLCDDTQNSKKQQKIQNQTEAAENEDMYEGTTRSVKKLMTENLKQVKKKEEVGKVIKNTVHLGNNNSQFTFDYGWKGRNEGDHESLQRVTDNFGPSSSVACAESRSKPPILSPKNKHKYYTLQRLLSAPVQKFGPDSSLRCAENRHQHPVSTKNTDQRMTSRGKLAVQCRKIPQLRLVPVSTSRHLRSQVSGLLNEKPFSSKMSSVEKSDASNLKRKRLESKDTNDSYRYRQCKRKKGSGFSVNESKELPNSTVIVSPNSGKCTPHIDVAVTSSSVTMATNNSDLSVEESFDSSVFALKSKSEREKENLRDTRTYTNDDEVGNSGCKDTRIKMQRLTHNVSSTANTDKKKACERQKQMTRLVKQLSLCSKSAPNDSKQTWSYRFKRMGAYRIQSTRNEGSTSRDSTNGLDICCEKFSLESGKKKILTKKLIY